MLRSGFVVACILLAGCSDGTAGPEEDDPFQGLPTEVDDDEGLIRGIVIDESVVPIEGAKVQLGDEASTQSDANGAFVFTDLSPGTYFLTVSKIGYDEVQTNAQVEAGVAQPPIVKVQLPRLPGSEPFVRPSMYEGYVSCALLAGTSLIGSDTCDPVGLFGEDDSSHWFTVDARPADMVQTEVQWKPNQPGGDRITLTEWACDPDGECSSAPGGNRICQIWGPSPAICRVTPEAGMGNPDGTGGGMGLEEAGFGTGGDPGFTVWIGADCADNLCVPGTAIGVGVLLEQTFQIYNHVFYNFQAPEEWVFVRDGAPEVPE